MTSINTELFQQLIIYSMLNSLRVIISSRRLFSGPLKFVKKKPLSLLNLFEHFSFSQAKKSQQFTFYDKEEQAIIAFLTLKYIKQADSRQLLTDNRSLRQKIYNLEHLTKRILSKAQSYEDQRQIYQKMLNEKKDNIQQSNIIELNKNGFKQANIQAVINGYDVKEGASINLKVWRQSRFIDSLSSNGKMLLLPNFGTGKIFQKIDNQIDKIIISGDKGSGKSFAYFNYAYLSDIIINYRLALIKQRQEYSYKFLQFVNVEEFQKVKKLFYFPFKYVNSIHDLQAIFQEQTHLPNAFKLNGSQLNHEDQIQKVSEFIKSIHRYHSDNGIKTVCIADQSNAYLSAFQSIQHFSLQNHIQLENYSNLFKCVDKIFYLLIYNSSQAVQSKWLHHKIQQATNIAKIKFHDPYEHDKITSNNYHIYYSYYMSTKQGHIFVYSLLWDELCKQLAKYNLQSNRYARLAFEKCFGLPLTVKGISLCNNIQQLKNVFQWWNIDVRPLNINSICKNESFLTGIKQVLIRLSQQLTQQNVEKSTLLLIQGFRQMKLSIQNHSEQICINRIKTYYNESQNNRIKSFRFLLIQKLAQIKNKTIVAQNQSPQIIADYDQLLLQYKSSNYYCYEGQMDDMCELLGTGYLIQQKRQKSSSNKDIPININQIIESFKDIRKIPQQYKKLLQIPKKKFKFLLTSSCLASIITQASANLEQVLMLAKNLRSEGASSPFLAGLIMDMLYFQLFQSSKIELHIKYLQKQNKRIFNISKTFPFNVQSQFNLTKQLKDIFSYANKHKEQYALGFQATFLTGQLHKNFKSDFRINTFNPVFDFIIIQERYSQIYINSFDATVDSIQNKIMDFKKQKHYNKLLKQIKLIFKQYKKKVVWVHQLLAFEELIYPFNAKKHKTAHFLMFKNRKISHERMSKEGMKSIQQSIGTLRLGICSAPRQCHFKLPFNQQAKEKSIYTEMKNIQQKLSE